jgi:protein TonB
MHCNVETGWTPPLFAAVEPAERGGRWALALIFAFTVHAGAWALFAQMRPSPHSTAGKGAELVFYAAAGRPGPPAAKSVEPPRRRRASRPKRAPRPPTSERAPAVVMPLQQLIAQQEEAPAEPADAPEGEPEDNVDGAGGGGGGGEGGFGLTGGGPLQLRELAQPPRLLERVIPDYPRQARLDSLRGTVVVRVIVGPDGRVEPASPQIVRSLPQLDGAVLAAVRRWRFSAPVDPQGRPVRVFLEIPFQFSLR